MPVYRLDARLLFPPPDKGPRRGPIAVGGDLRPERLLLAYSLGIFPWQGEPLHWHSPDPRMVLLADELRVSRSLAKTIRQGRFRVSLDTDFAAVMVACATVPRPGQDGTWITPAMVDAYGELHRRGVAHSVEAWSGDTLVGGLYGISLGAAFFGESMFARERDASKVAFVALVEQLGRWQIPLVDCQVHTPHLESLGAREWPRRSVPGGASSRSRVPDAARPLAIRPRESSQRRADEAAARGLERRAKIVRQRALADEPPTADRVRQREPPGVQHQARHREPRAPAPGPARRSDRPGWAGPHAPGARGSGACAPSSGAPRRAAPEAAPRAPRHPSPRAARQGRPRRTRRPPSVAARGTATRKLAAGAAPGAP